MDLKGRLLLKAPILAPALVVAGRLERQKGARADDLGDFR